MKGNTAKLSMIAAMLVFGIIGIFRNMIPMPSSVVALIRGGGGTAFLLVFCLVTGKKLSGSAIRSNLPLLTVSGACIGFNYTCKALVNSCKDLVNKEHLEIDKEVLYNVSVRVSIRTSLRCIPI